MAVVAVVVYASSLLCTWNQPLHTLLNSNDVPSVAGTAAAAAAADLSFFPSFASSIFSLTLTF